MKKLKITSITHRGEKRLKLDFEKNQAIIDLLKSNFDDLKWSRTLAAWHLPYHKNSVNELYKALKGKIWLDYSQLSKKNERKKVKTYQKSDLLRYEIDIKAKTKLSAFEKYLQSNRYSQNTVNSYLDAINTLIAYFGSDKIEHLNNKDVIDFNTQYILKRKLSASYQNQIVNAIKLFYKTIENKELDLSALHRPRKERKLPKVLSKAEVKQILEAPTNIKHRAMLSLIYACGLRRAELLNLKPEDIDSERKLLLIRGAKGKKDRIAPLSNKIIDLLREYYKMYRPKIWLFEGQHEKSQYSEVSLRNVLKKATLKVNINKPVTLHWLRHSFATHLLESGTGLRYIQEILGHNSSKTTEIYTFVSRKNIQNIRSPFDDL